MPLEIEQKFRLPDHEAFRARLLTLGPATGPVAFEINRLFDNEERSLKRSNCGLRIRSVRVGERTIGLLTYKGPRQPGPLKVREELETLVEDPATLADVFARLGYRERIHYEKRRETWQVGACEVTIDELPKLGWFCEIEGPDEQSVELLQAQLNLPDGDLVPESYVELTDREGDRDADGRAVLAFGSAG